jgi:four helix bundle protein
MCQISKTFPPEDKFSLTDQIRRSSRSVCAHIAEGYRKRTYKKIFLLKLADPDGEGSETRVWLDFAFNCGFLAIDDYREIAGKLTEIGKLLGFMIQNPEKYQ